MSTHISEAEWIWFDGELVRWHEAKLHVLSLAVQFGSSVFEGVRCYRTAGDRGPAIFRLGEHLERLAHSARVFRMEIPYAPDALAAACAEAVERNGLEDCYLRPMVLRGYGAAGMNRDGLAPFIPSARHPVIPHSSDLIHPPSTGIDAPVV